MTAAVAGSEGLSSDHRPAGGGDYQGHTVTRGGANPRGFVKQMSLACWQ
jgi:hypothetical protein